MKTKILIATTAFLFTGIIVSNAQSWNLSGNTGTSTSDFIGTTDAKALRIKTNNQVRMFIKSNGDIGIGTNSPVAKLDVNGTMKGSQLLIGTATGATGYVASIKGKLIAEEVRVDLSAAWPDYVFEERYPLMSLHELEQYVAENKHLPGIPSSGEVESGGIMLGEMQARTIEKVEEAMLYIIQLNKENRQLKARLDILEKELQSLKK